VEDSGRAAGASARPTNIHGIVMRVPFIASDEMTSLPRMGQALPKSISSTWCDRSSTDPDCGYRGGSKSTRE
jgi:hypothetical protein